MAILKKLLFGGIGVVAIAGIATGIGVGINNSRTVESSMNETESKPSEDDKNSSSSETTTQPTTIDLKKLVSEIKPDNIVFKKDNKVVTQQERKEVYAFNVTNDQLDLDEATKKKIPQTVKIQIKLNNSNNGLLLNNGLLSLTVEGIKTDKKETKEINTVTLTGFKQTTTHLSRFFATNSKETNKAAVLDLTKAKNAKTPIPATTIEQLNTFSVAAENTVRTIRKAGLTESNTQTQNQVSGLTTLFQTVNKPADDMTMTNKTISIQGKVKLASISKEGSGKDEKTYFHLVSASHTPLKLIDTKEKIKEEALVNEIKVSNLLVSSINFIPVGLEQESQDKYLADFKSMAEAKMFKGSGENGFHIEVKKAAPPESKAVNVKINPYFLKRTAKEQALEVNLEINFGSGSEIKTYSTTKEADLKELKDGGFNFEIYSKNLEDSSQVIEANKIMAMNNMLDSYFIENGTTTAIKKTDIKTTQGDNGGMILKGGFSLVSLSEINMLQSNIKIGDVKKVMDDEDGAHPKADTGNENWITENWISFVGYSFKGLANEQSVLFIPTINLIHIQEPTSATGTGVGA